MTHEPFPVERLRSALEAWDPADADVVEPIPPGATADVFLVQRGEQRWVAKYGYQSVREFNAGLAVSELLDLPGWDVGTPVRTDDGGLSCVLEWPSGHPHPLALLRHVEGVPLRVEDPASVDVMASVCGRVHAQLLGIDREAVGAKPLPDGPIDEWDLGAHQWLDDVLLDVRERTTEARPRVRSCVGVWDGPDVLLRDDGSIGLIDFGHTTWQPLVNVVANRSLVAAYDDADQLARFVDVLQRELPLTSNELEVLPLYRRQNAAAYARWAAMRVQEHGDQSAVDWLDTLLRFLRSDVER